MHNPFSLENKTILVTGASSGIGRAVAVEISRMGANVIITGRNKKRLQDTFDLLEKGDNLLYEVELTNGNELQSFVDELPKLNGVVNSVGIIQPLVIKLMEENDVNDLFQVNTLMPIHLTRLLLQQKKINKDASIVYISSINGNNCISYGNSIYGATKSGLSGFMKGVALEFASRGIRANCINPGMIETELFKNTAIGNKELERDKLNYPLKRYGKPEEVAYAAVYLLSDASKWVTGTDLIIDGGYTLQ